MATLLKRSHRIIGAGALLLVLIAALPAGAQQPASVNPEASVVREQQLLLKTPRIEGRVSIPDTRESVLIQPFGREWRMFREVVLPWFAAVSILVTTILLAILYAVRGPIRVERGRSGRTLQRFNIVERFLHWLVTFCFVILALSGLNITFGKSVLLPLIGPEAFSAFTSAVKYAHNFLSFPFVLGITMLFLLWVKDNFPTAADVEWLKQGGGFIGSKHPPAWRFNAGQKMLFWGIVGATVVSAFTGFLLIFPFYFTNIFGMQASEIIHGVVAMAFIAAIIAHVYIGTLGMEGGFDGMADGMVDLNWAKQHHPLWVEQELAKDRKVGSPVQRAMTPMANAQAESKDTTASKPAWPRRLWRVLAAPSARYSILMLVGGGLVLGTALTLGFNAALQVTSSNEFCLSCHAENAGLDWKRSSHYTNRSGLVVGCVDCHEPRAFVPRMIRKTQAFNEIWHQLIGTISTPEKYEAHRLDLAQREWARLGKNGSQECQNCHQPDAMAEAAIRNRHKAVLSGGQACTDCHKGVAHKAP
jgi:formate dehydrogenase subunit gamma